MALDDLSVIPKEDISIDDKKVNAEVDYPIRITDKPEVYHLAPNLIAHTMCADSLINLDEHYI